MVALWRLASVWDTKRGRALRVAPRKVTVSLPAGARVRLADPVASAPRAGFTRAATRVRVALGGSPLVLQVARR